MKYGKTVRADFQGGKETKIVLRMDPAASLARTAVTAGTTRKDTMNTATGITSAPTMDAMRMSCTRMMEAPGRAGGEVGHGIDLDPARPDQKESIISVTIDHTVPPNPLHPQI